MPIWQPSAETASNKEALEGTGIPLEGSHHLVDMLAGLVLFVVVLWLWRTFVGPPQAVR